MKIILFLLLSFNAFSQQKIKNLQVDTLQVLNQITSGKIDIASTTLASKPCPVMSEAQRDAIVSPVNGDCVFNDDQETWNIYNGSIWKQISGGGGQGGINYITNNDAELNINGWVTYLDTAGISPVDGVGGTANITFTRSTVDPMRGNASFLITKDAFDRQGEGVAFDFEIDRADQPSVLKISFDYESSANYADGDIRVYIYDITNTQVIEPLAVEVFAKERGGKHVAAFQTNSDSVDYRLIFHIASANALAYTFKIDNIFLGPSIPSAGVPDKQITLAANGDFTSGNIEIVRIGNTVTITCLEGLGHTSASSASTSVGFLPSWAIPQAEYRNVYASTGSILRQFEFRVNGQINVEYRNYSGTLTAAVGAGAFSFSYIASPSNEIASSREVIGEVRTATINLTGSGDFTGGQIKVSKVGNQVIVEAFESLTHASLVAASSATGVIPLWARPNSTNKTNTYTSGVNDIRTILITPSGQITSTYFNYSGTATTRTSSGTFTVPYITAEDSNGIQGFAFDTTVAALYRQNSGQATSGVTTIIYNSKEKDTHNAYNLSNGRYTAPISGLYSVSAIYRTAPRIWAVNDVVAIYFRINNATNFLIKSLRVYTTSSQGMSYGASSLVYLNKGDTLEIQCEISGNPNLASSNNQNILSIQRIGN
jgi:hypothetical protein